MGFSLLHVAFLPLGARCFPAGLVCCLLELLGLLSPPSFSDDLYIAVPLVLRAVLTFTVT